MEESPRILILVQQPIGNKEFDDHLLIWDRECQFEARVVPSQEAIRATCKLPKMGIKYEWIYVENK
jgi:hypothetical protein